MNFYTTALPEQKIIVINLGTHTSTIKKFNTTKKVKVALNPDKKTKRRHE